VFEPDRSVQQRYESGIPVFLWAYRIIVEGPWIRRFTVKCKIFPVT